MNESDIAEVLEAVQMCTRRKVEGESAKYKSVRFTLMC